MEKMFEKASVMKLRFNYKGICSVEDLWDISLPALDQMYKNLRKEQKNSDEESLLKTASEENNVLSLQIDLIKYIVDLRIAAKQQIAEASEKAAKKQRLLRIISDKQDQEHKDMSIEDLTKLVEAL